MSGVKRKAAAAEKQRPAKIAKQNHLQAIDVLLLKYDTEGTFIRDYPTSGAVLRHLGYGGDHSVASALKRALKKKVSWTYRRHGLGYL